MTTFMLPDLGEGLQDAELVAWHVAAGDHVVADQPLASVETEKAVVEIPSPRSGRIARLCAAPGDRVKVGAPLVEFEEAAHADEGAVVGQLPVEERAAVVVPAKPGTVKASPAVRALARRLGVELGQVVATGPGGAISSADVEAAVSRVTPARDRISATRRAMARKMTRAHAEVVPATVCDDADVGDWPEDADVLSRLVCAIAAGATAEPALNARYDSGAESLERLGRIDIGIAVDTEAGLIVPVLRDAGRLAGRELANELARLKDAARRRTLAAADMRDPSITLSNFGSLGGRYAQLVVVPPQVAILGAGRIAPRVVPGSSGPAIRRMLPLSLTFDHRAVTGGEAARFLTHVIADLQRSD